MPLDFPRNEFGKGELSTESFHHFQLAFFTAWEKKFNPNRPAQVHVCRCTGSTEDNSFHYLIIRQARTASTFTIFDKPISQANSVREKRYHAIWYSGLGRVQPRVCVPWFLFSLSVCVVAAEQAPVHSNVRNNFVPSIVPVRLLKHREGSHLLSSFIYLYPGRFSQWQYSCAYKALALVSNVQFCPASPPSVLLIAAVEPRLLRGRWRLRMNLRRH